MNGKCCRKNDTECICEADPDNEICKGEVCSVGLVYCDERTGKCG